MTVICIPVFVGMKICDAAGQTLEDTDITVGVEEIFIGTIDVEGSFFYTYTVTSKDGPVSIGFGAVSSDNPDLISDEELERMFTVNARDIGPGGSGTLTGRIGTGTYAWVVVNMDENNPVNVHVYWHGK